MNLPALVRDLGCDPDLVFASAGFSTAQFADPDTEIPFITTSKLLANCVMATGCDHLGLLLGERTVSSSLGVAGFMLPAAPDVGTALRGLVQHLSLHDRGAGLTLTSDGRFTLLGYAIHLHGVTAIEQIYDLSMTVGCGIMRSLCGRNWAPREILLSRPPPQDTAPYRRFFQAPLRFDAEQNALVFQTNWLEFPIASADSLLFRHLEKEATEIQAQQESDFVTDIRLLLRRCLLANHCDAGSIARQLGMHERTLNRRLREEGTNFRRELEQMRYQLARQLLANPHMPATRIAEALDYANATAFSRAFKRWAGVTPTEWRAIHQHA
jgi:AraC-like DNA-binding protein